MNFIGLVLERRCSTTWRLEHPSSSILRLSQGPCRLHLGHLHRRVQLERRRLRIGSAVHLRLLQQTVFRLLWRLQGFHEEVLSCSDWRLRIWSNRWSFLNKKLKISLLQWAPLNGITDDRINRLMGLNLSDWQVPNSSFTPNFTLKVVHLLLSIDYWNQFVSGPKQSH